MFKVVRCADFEALKTFKKKLRSNLKKPDFYELNSGENTALFKDRLLGDVCAFPSVSFEDAQSFVAEAVEKKSEPCTQTDHLNGKREGKGWIPFVRGGKGTALIRGGLASADGSSGRVAEVDGAWPSLTLLEPPCLGLAAPPPLCTRLLLFSGFGA